MTGIFFNPRTTDKRVGQEQAFFGKISAHLPAGTSGKGAREDVGQGAELELRHASQRHVVKGRAVGEVQLLEVEAPVQVGLRSLLVDLGLDVGLLEADSALGLLADDGDVVLQGRESFG